MRAYHFLSAQNALDDLRNKRIKLSEIDKLNDPFELFCAAQDDPTTRLLMNNWRQEMTRKFGVLSFCRGWHNPVLWSHYGDRHRGICLGFDILDGTVKPVRYVRKRTALAVPPDQSTMDEILFTKYKDWEYEQELRGWFQLDTRHPTGFYFYDFDEKLRLREVIAGPLCDSTRSEIEAAVGNRLSEVGLIKARLAFRSFKIVTQQQGFPPSTAGSKDRILGVDKSTSVRNQAVEREA